MTEGCYSRVAVTSRSRTRAWDESVLGLPVVLTGELPLTSSSMDPSSQPASDPERLLDVVFGSWKTQAIHVAARLGLADLLAEGPRSAVALARATGADAPALRRLLRALCSLDLCRESEDGAFEITPLGSLLRSDAVDSLRSWSIHWGGTSWSVWGHLLDSVLTGRSARAILEGTEGFEHLQRDPDAAEIFHRAMGELTRMVAGEIVRAIDWTGVRRVVDVGGGRGDLLKEALTARPDVQGVLFDTPEVVERGERHLRSVGIETRCEFVPGDFFDSIPATGDIYVLKSVLHNWSDEDALRILEVCRRAIGSSSRLVIVERFLPRRLDPTPDHQAIAGRDLHMLVQLGGRERTEAELRGLLTSAGFRADRVTRLRSTLFLLEASSER